MSLLLHIKDYVLYKKETAFNCPQRKSMEWFLALDLFLWQSRAKENVKYFFSAWLPDHGLLVKDDQQWKTFWMIYNMAMLGRKKIFPTYQLWRHNILYRTRYLVLPAFWSHSVLLKIGQYAKENLMIYILSIFGKIIFWLP